MGEWSCDERKPVNAMSKFQRSWLLLKNSISVIRRNPRLLAFPLVTALCTLVIALFFLAPVALWPTGHSYTEAAHWEAIGQSLFSTPADASGDRRELVLTPGAMVYVAVLYLLSMVTATFFNVAFYHEILAALGGQPVSLGRGLRFAGTRWKGILMWSLFAGLVGLIIKTLEQKLDLIGRLVARLLGLAWSVASIFVIPVLVRESRSANPVEMLRQSAGILKRTWGEMLIGYVGLTFGNALIAIGSVLLLCGALITAIALQNYWIVAGVGLVWFVTLVAWSYLVSVASHVYRGALYLYAAEGVVAEPYNQELLDAAWKFKKR
jgi:hypothetical protein